jgi:pyridoxine 5-phosphate synthase
VLIHTGRFCWAASDAARATEFDALTNAVKMGHRLGLAIHAGGGLTFQSIGALAELPEITAVDVGHGVIARAALTGMGEAVREVRQLLQGGSAR